jgi:hypothetical protein
MACARGGIGRVASHDSIHIRLPLVGVGDDTHRGGAVRPAPDAELCTQLAEILGRWEALLARDRRELTEEHSQDVLERRSRRALRLVEHLKC